ncbi:endo-1,4-beta-xylanase [Micromonospora sp. NPDC051300]|uniref:endo-1,4-beta-xylanase n=1 Tax=Micromonospora sp. NPDC051300 TaxID=3364286 RepID=UPI00378AFF45
MDRIAPPPWRRRVAAAGVGLLTLGLGAVVAQAATQTAPGGPSLRDAGAARGLLIGAAVTGSALRGEIEQPYLDALKREFSAVTPENDMKWSYLQPEPGAFDFTAADRLVELAEANGQKVHGHTLAWHSQNPVWVDQLTDRATAERVLEQHIKTVVGRYKGRIAYWDVVNEAIADGETGRLRDSVWLRTIGPDYIEKAFRWAHEADPAAKLYYNDYENGDLGGKSNGVYDLLRRLKAKGVPVDGVGIQAHSRPDRRTDGEYTRNLNRLAALGLEIQITELDSGIALPATPEKLQNQARIYRETAEYCLRQPRCVGITTWGLTDKYSWIETADPGYGQALPLDATYQPKPAYHALRDALLARPSPPVAPTDVVVETGDGAVRVSWAGTVAPGSTYEIRYGPSRNALTRTVSVADTTTTRITGLRNGRDYVFAVVARNALGASAPSAPVAARPVARLARPAFAAPRPDHKTLELSWRRVPGATGYVVEHHTSPDGPTQRTDVGDVTNYRLGDLTNGTRYDVSVHAYHADGDGSPSATRTATPRTRATPVVTAPETTGTIAVDGRLTETEWRRLPVSLEKATYRSTRDRGRAGVTWDTQRIYFAGRVVDETRVNDSIDPWQDDTFEIFLNGRGDLPASYDTASDRHYFLRWNDDTLHEQNGRTAGATYRWSTTPDGYAVELSVTWQSLGIVPGEAGARIGVDFALDDDDTGGIRDGQKTAFGFESNYLDLSAIGRAKLTIRYATSHLPLVPLVDCVIDNGDGTRTSRFGYANENNGRVAVPVGRHNAFDPAPVDRDQPGIFARGDQERFYADFTGDSLTWRLRGPDGRTRTAVVDAGTPRCATIPAVPLYRDALSTGWTSFAYNSTIDPAATGTVHDGTRAMSVTVTGAYGLAGLENKAAPLQLTEDSALEMWINVDPTSGPRTFGFVSSSGVEGAPSSTPVYFTVPPGGWVKKTFSHADLGNADQLQSFYLQDVGNLPGTQPPVHLDDIRVLNVKAPEENR